MGAPVVSRTVRAAGPCASTVIRLVLVLIVGWASGCGPSEPVARGEPRPEDIDRLRALPYAGSTPARRGEPAGVIRRDPSRSSPGFNLYTVQQLSRAELVDERGRILRAWSHEPSMTWENCTLLPNGDLLVVGAEPAPGQRRRRSVWIADDARYLLRFDWEGGVLWKRRIRAHHDVEPTPDGRLLALTFERRLLPRFHETVPVRDDRLTLLEPDGTPVRSNSILDAVEADPHTFPLDPVRPTRLGGPPWLDLFHANSVEWVRRDDLAGTHPIYTPGNVLVCFRHQNRIAVFRWSSNRVVWAWGREVLGGPHDAQILDDGNILLFDNGLGRGASRGLELDPRTERIVWSYRGDPPSSFYTRTKGSIQRLPNGNTLMAESDRGRAIEVTRDGEVVWEFLCPHRIGADRRATIVRMRRYPRSFVERIVEDRGDGSGSTRR